VDALGGLDWAARLLPERVDHALRLPDDALLVYQRVGWGAPAVGAEALTAGVAWTCPHRDQTEQGLWCEARSGDRVVAAALLVVRHPGTARAHQPSGLPTPPEVPTAAVDLPLIITEDEVHTFVTQVDGRYPATTARGAAQARGYAGILVPGTVLLTAARPREARHDEGALEGWFRGPVTAGALLTRRRSADGSVDALYLPGRDRPSLLVRVSRIDTAAGTTTG
jgi:hypothetical protein